MKNQMNNSRIFNTKRLTKNKYRKLKASKARVQPNYLNCDYLFFKPVYILYFKAS